MDYMIRKEVIENSTLTGYVKGKKDEEKQLVTHLKCLCEWMTHRNKRGTVKVKKEKIRKL